MEWDGIERNGRNVTPIPDPGVIMPFTQRARGKGRKGGRGKREGRIKSSKQNVRVAKDLYSDLMRLF